MHTEEWPLACVMPLPHFSVVCSVYIMNVYMDDITVYGGSFEECLINLEIVLNRCIEKNPVLNWEMPLHGQKGNSAGAHYLRKRD